MSFSDSREPQGRSNVPPVPEGAGSGPVRAGVAVVLRRTSRGGIWFLIARRFPDAHLPDLWEFPGGKVHPPETGADCARREVLEETGVRVAVRGHLLDRDFVYPDRTVALEFYVCDYLDGLPQAVGCRAVRWVSPENLECYPFPGANGPVLDALQRGGWLETRADLSSAGDERPA